MLTGNRVVITGMGVLAPNGIGIDEFWRTLLAGESGIGPITLFDSSDLKCHIAGEVTNFDPLDYIDYKLAKRMSRASHFAIAGAVQAIGDAGLSIDYIRRNGRMPITLGVSSTAMDLRELPPRAWSAVAGVPHATTSAISFALGFDAKLRTISDGCSSGLDAIAAAAENIAYGINDIEIAGGADSSMAHYTFSCFDKARKLSVRNDEPELASRPFDIDRDGGVVSEGAGVFILENLEHALARDAEIYAEIIGYGTAADPIGSIEGAGMALAMQDALSSVPVCAEQIECISAHAPSDEHMDAIETLMIKKVFGDYAYRIPITSIKGAVGNAMGVGGAHQAVAAALSLRDSVIPMTANLENPDVELDLDYVRGSSRAVNLNTVLINTHAFGRGNSSLILKRYNIRK